MIFRSAKTENGNVGISYNSQTEADTQAKDMDTKHCSGCSDCSNCSYCSNCSNCSNCSGCSYCSGCPYCSSCSYCSGCSYCLGCSHCSNCSYCSNCSDCSRCLGCLRWTGPKSENLMSINGLCWPVTISNTHMQIGCKNHSLGDWTKFKDARIDKMDSTALEFWQQWKHVLMLLAQTKL